MRAFLLSCMAGGLALGAVACTRAQPPIPLQPIATIKDIMDGTVDPSADVIWQSVETVVSAAGTEDKQPRTDEEWKNVRNNANRVIEATNLIMMEGRKVAKPGEKSANPGVELQPEEIEAAINGDKATFFSRAIALRVASVKALEAIDKRDAQGLIDAGEQMDTACENCHLKYWYPNGGPPKDAAPAAPLGKSGN